MAQVTDDELVVAVDAESNSLAVIMKHIAGNLRSRFTDFLTDRRREAGPQPRRRVRDRRQSRSRGDHGRLGERLGAPLRLPGCTRPDDLLKEVRVRGEALPALAQINRQMTHHAYHVGQIVFMAKHLRSSDWRNLSLPPRLEK